MPWSGTATIRGIANDPANSIATHLSVASAVSPVAATATSGNPLPPPDGPSDGGLFLWGCFSHPSSPPGHPVERSTIAVAHRNVSPPYILPSTDFPSSHGHADGLLRNAPIDTLFPSHPRCLHTTL